MFTIKDFGVIITAIVLITFYVPLSTHYIWQLYSKAYLVKKVEDVHSCVFLRQRYSSLSLIASLAYIIQFFDLSLWIFVYSDWYDKNAYQHILVSTASSLHILTQFIITLALTLRFWLIHFRMKFEMMSANHEWKKIINSKYIHDEHNNNCVETSMYNVMNQMEQRINSAAFVLRYKATLGNHRWCLWRAILIFVTLLIMLIFAEYINYDTTFIPQNLHWMQLLANALIYGAFGGLWSVLLFLHCRSPDFNDSLHIKKELSYVLQTMMFFLIIYIVFIVLFGLGLSNANVYADHYFSEIIILFHVIAFSNMVMLYVIVFYPLKKSKVFGQMSVHREESVTAKDREFSVEFTRSKSRPESPRNKPKSIAKQLKIEGILRNKYGFDAFMQHLSSEFSMENLLSLAEFLQFKLYVHRKDESSHMNKDLRYWLYMLPLDAMPRSEIVYFGDNPHTGQPNLARLKLSTKSASYEQASMSKSPSIDSQQNSVRQIEIVTSDEMRALKLKAYNLYFKYIRAGSEYEINISYEMRLMYKRILDNKEEWIGNEGFNDLVKLRDLFDDCCTIMKRLIGHSFMRFKHSKYFEKVKEKFKISAHLSNTALFK